MVKLKTIDWFKIQEVFKRKGTKCHNNVTVSIFAYATKGKVARHPGMQLEYLLFIGV